MTSFVTRVEIHNGSAEDYLNLNTVMEAAGFSRAIQSSEGTAVCLPTGQYIGNGELTAGEVSLLAQSAALKTKKGFAVFVSDLNVAAWFGLDPVVRPADAK